MCQDINSTDGQKLLKKLPQLLTKSGDFLTMALNPLMNYLVSSKITNKINEFIIPAKILCEPNTCNDTDITKFKDIGIN